METVSSPYARLLDYFRRYVSAHPVAAMGTFVLIGAAENRHSGIDLDEFDIVALGFPDDDNGGTCFVEMLNCLKGLLLVDFIPDPSGGPDELLVITEVGQAVWDSAMRSKRKQRRPSKSAASTRLD